jgi:hypothetical protein
LAASYFSQHAEELYFLKYYKKMSDSRLWLAVAYFEMIDPTAAPL